MIVSELLVLDINSLNSFTSLYILGYILSFYMCNLLCARLSITAVHFMHKNTLTMSRPDLISEEFATYSS